MKVCAITAQFKTKPRMKTNTIFASSLQSFEAALNTLVTPNFRPNLCVVFASVATGISQLQKVFQQHQITMVGASSCGEIVSDGQHTHILEESIVAVFFELPPDAFTVYLKDKGALSDYEIGQAAASHALEQFTKPGLIVLGSGLRLNGQSLVEGLVEVLGMKTPLYGGLAGDDALFVETFVFTDKQLSTNGVLVLTFDTQQIEMTGLATSGWISLGADLVVSSSDGNIVHAIDGQPALDMYLRYLSVSEDDMPSIGVEYPLMIKRPDGSDALRAVMSVDKNTRSLVFAGSVPEGSIVTFSSSPGFEVIDHTRGHIAKFEYQGEQPDCCLIFSCMARHLALGPLISEEIEAVNNRWPVPMAGLFTYGEIGNNPGMSCDFHNQTFTMVLLRQKNN